MFFCRAIFQKWGSDTDEDRNDQLGQVQSMEHPLVCPNLENTCTVNVLETLTHRAMLYMQNWIDVQCGPKVMSPEYNVIFYFR